jgi:hypothetical protein
MLNNPVTACPGNRRFCPGYVPFVSRLCPAWRRCQPLGLRLPPITTAGRGVGRFCFR